MERVQFEGQFLKLTTEERPDGRVAERVYKRPGVSIIAVDHNGDICFIDEKDFHTGKVNRKLPSGYVDPGEDPLLCAKRELAEETGLTADHWELFITSEMKGPILATQYYFVARGLRRGEPSPNAGEEILNIVYLKQSFVRNYALNGGFGTTGTAYALLRFTNI